MARYKISVTYFVAFDKNFRAMLLENRIGQKIERFGKYGFIYIL